MIRNHGWQQRISTQVDRLLINPKFGSPDNYGPEVRELNFPSMFREAMRIEIADRKQDWSVPTDKEINQVLEFAVQKTVTPLPATVMIPVQPEPQTIQSSPRIVSTTQESVYQIEVQSGTKGQSYTVKLDKLGAWTCTCKAFTVGPKGQQVCKHIQFAQTQYSQPPEKPVEPVVPDNLGKVFYPSQANAHPQTPVILDGTKPVPPNMQNRGGFVAAPPVARPKLQIPDEWSVPATKPVSKKLDNIVPVGGKVVMGRKP